MVGMMNIGFCIFNKTTVGILNINGSLILALTRTSVINQKMQNLKNIQCYILMIVIIVLDITIVIVYPLTYTGIRDNINANAIQYAWLINYCKNNTGIKYTGSTYSTTEPDISTVGYLLHCEERKQYNKIRKCQYD